MFLKLRGNEIYVRKSCLDLAGYHWTQETDHGSGGWGLSLLSRVLSLLLHCCTRKIQRRLNGRGREQQVSVLQSRNMEELKLIPLSESCRPLCVLISLAASEHRRDWRINGLRRTQLFNGRVLRKPGFAMTITCC